jgi:DNA-binding transcriptional LysR family regulator
MPRRTRSSPAKESSSDAQIAEATNGRGWLNLRMIEVFVAVIQEDGMTNAARRLGMTQSAVSQAITTIEAGLGGQLIDRSVRPAHLTLFGSAFYDRAVEMLHRARELEHLVDMQQHARLAQLRIGMVDSLASTAGPSLLREIASLAARWSVVSGVQQTSLKSLTEQRVDMIVTTEDAASDPALLALTVLREPLLIVAPKDMDTGKGSVAELGARLPLVRYSPGGFLSRQVTAYLQQNDVPLPRAYEFDTSDAVLAMVRAGMGWTITTPLCVLKASTVLRDLKFLPLERAPARTLRVIAYKDEHSALWERVAATARTILKHEWLPVMKQLAPWSEVHVD